MRVFKSKGAVVVRPPVRHLSAIGQERLCTKKKLKTPNYTSSLCLDAWNSVGSGSGGVECQGVVEKLGTTVS